MNTKEDIETVPIGDKEIKSYINACKYAFNNSNEVLLVSRGNNIKRAIDVAAIFIRQYLENPTYEITIGSEGYEERNVSTLEILLKGVYKDESKSLLKED